MIKVAIATQSPDKIRGIKEAFFRLFCMTDEQEVQFYPVKSETGVPNQPFDSETYLGALNRAGYARDTYPGMDYYVSCEAGIESEFGEYFNVQVVCILFKNEVYWGKSAGWNIPSEDVENIRKNSLDKYLRKKGISCIEELLGPSHSRSAAVAQATEFALASGKLRNN